MPTELLEFEEPIGVLLKEIEALSMLPRTAERERSIDSLRRRADDIRGQIYANLTPWQRVLVARHPSRPNTLDYVERLFTNFDELHGDRRFADDHAIVAGAADYKGEPVVVIGHQKGRDTKQKIFRNFGYARPEGYRKALRVMLFANKFSRPIVVFIDTPAAYPGMESEERGVAELAASEADVWVGGIVSGLRPLKTKKGDRMAVFMLDDIGGSLEVVVFPEAFAKHSSLIDADAMLLVRGKFEKDDESARIVATELMTIGALKERTTREVAIHLSMPPHGRPTFETVAELLARHRGDRKVVLELDVKGQQKPFRVRAAYIRRSPS